MDKKGQVTVGAFIMLAITVIVGVILLQGSAQNVGETVNTVTLANYSIGTAPAVDGSYYFTDYKSLESVVIYNATGTLVPSANYTVTNNVVYNGALATQLTVGSVNEYAEQEWNVSATAQPLTYANDAGSRAMANLIVTLMGLALAAVVIVYVVKGYNG